MQLICGGENIEIEEVIEQYSAMLFRLAMVRMQQKEDAEEVVQDTYLRLIRRVKKGMAFENQDHLKAWLLTVAANRGKSLISQAWNQRTQGFCQTPEIAAEEPEEFGAYEYVQKLPEKYRVAIQLFYYEQLPTEQIAVIMETKPATVRSYLHRGREKLKVMMESGAYVERERIF